MKTIKLTKKEQKLLKAIAALSTRQPSTVEGRSAQTSVQTAPPAPDTYTPRHLAERILSSRGTLEAIPLRELERILKKHNVLEWDQSISPGNASN